STEEEKKLQDWLAAPDCSTNYTTALNNKVTGTGQWIFKDLTYLKWKEEGSILWIQGKGNVLYISVIDSQDVYLTSNSVIYHYFDMRDNIGAKSSFQGFLLSLLLQLGAQDQKIDPALKDLYNASKNGLSLSKPTDTKLVNTLKKIMKNMIQKKHQIYIVIDALDECKNALLVIELVAEIACFSMIKIIISSRNHPSENLKCSTISLSGNDMVQKDIAIFMEMKIAIENTSLKAKVQETLMEKADGGFRYIDCQVQSLKDCTNAKTVHQVLDQLPSSLNETYAEAMKKCKKGHNFENIHHLLLWLLHSSKPLNTSQVEIIFSIDLSSSTIDSSNGIKIKLEDIVDTTLVTTNDKKIVQLAHASVKEFLLQNQDNIHQSDLFDLNAHLAHNVIAQMCLIYLQQQIYSETIWFESAEVQDITTFGQYATRYWAEHSKYNEKAQMPNEETIKLTLDFVQEDSKSFENWKKNYYPIPAEELTLKDCNILHIIAYLGLTESAGRLFSNILASHSNPQNHKTSHKGDALGSVIQAAAYGGHKDIVELLLDNGADIEAQGGFHGTAIEAAAAKGHKDIVELLLLHNANVNTQGGYYGTAMQAAAAEGYKDVVELLLLHNADVNAQSGEYGTAIEAAAELGHKDIVELLLKHNADVNIQGGYYESVMKAATAQGHIDILEILLLHGADVNDVQSGEFGTAIEVAAEVGSKDIVEWLLMHNADVNIQGGYFGTAIEAAAEEGHKDIVELLLIHNADINAQAGYYGTAMQGAASEGHKDIIELLLSHGANINAQAGYYGTALHAAAAKGHKDIVELLLNHGANLNTQAGYYGTALQGAATNGHKDIVEFLLNHDADLSTQVGYYGTAIQGAAANGHKDIIELLLEHGANTNAQAGYYGTAIQAATAEGHKNIVELLLLHGAEINISAGYFGTAVQAAAARGHSDIVQLLLDHKADVSINAGYFGSAIQAATATDHKDIAELLQKHTADVNV
ncbi:ankyrin repeat-containing domain protein, partial [Lentinula raphanica]